MILPSTALSCLYLSLYNFIVFTAFIPCILKTLDSPFSAGLDPETISPIKPYPLAGNKLFDIEY